MIRTNALISLHRRINADTIDDAEELIMDLLDGTLDELIMECLEYRARDNDALAYQYLELA